MEITEINETANTISGKATPNKEVYIYGGNDYEWDELTVPVNNLGNWLADFKGRVDLIPGTDGWAEEYDGQGNMTSIPWNIPNPHFEVDLLFEQVFGYEWPPNTPITVNIDGRTWTNTSNNNGYVSFESGSIRIHLGSVITMTDGITIRTHTVSLKITEIDQNTNTISGIAAPGSEILAQYFDSYWNGFWLEPVDETGEWVADFTWLQEFTPGLEGRICAYDIQGNFSTGIWYVADPTFEVNPQEDSIWAYKWPLNTTLTLSIEGEDMQWTAQSPNFMYYTIFYIDNFDIQPGQTLTITGGGYTRTHTVSYLSITNIDQAKDTVSGIATPNTEIKVIAWDTLNWVYKYPMSDSQGAWTANFKGSVDIKPGVNGWAYEFDTQGNSTEISWVVPNPTIQVYVNEDRIEGDMWPPYTDITINIGSNSWTITSYSSGDFRLYFNNFAIQKGQKVTVTGGGYTRTHTVTNLEVTQVIEATNVVKGKATPNNNVEVLACGDKWCYEKTTSVDSKGNWSVNFTDTLNFKPGTVGWAYEYDATGNATVYNFFLPDPIFTIYPQFDEISGRYWPPNAEVTLTIDDTHTFTATSDSGGGNVYFYDLDFDIQTGQVIKLTSGTYSRTHKVNLELTEVDWEADRVTGLATPNSTVEVFARNPQDYKQLNPVADSEGTWLADFSGLLDFGNGTYGYAEDYDTQGNSTRVSWDLSSPGIWSDEGVTFTVGEQAEFTIKTFGDPAPSITYQGALPGGITFTDQGNGTAKLAGTSQPGTGGVYPLTITAENEFGEDTQSFTLTVNEAPTFTSANNTTFSVDNPGEFTITTSGQPHPAITYKGTLPGGITFADQGNGTAKLSGTPEEGTNGTYKLTLTASNGLEPKAVQTFTLTINEAPVFTSADSKTFQIGKSSIFLVTTSGKPAPALTYEGMLPDGLTFEDSGTGMAFLYGTPASATAGTYYLTFIANNGIHTAVQQPFTLTIQGFAGCATQTSIPQAECEAITALFALNGAGWTQKTNWLETDDPADWYGVTVENGHVVGINLSSNNLVGELPTEIGNLVHLQSLILAGNKLEGSISPSIFELTDLATLDLGSNRFTGTIPHAVGNLTNLVELKLNNNRLTGQIPPELGALENLETLRLGRNQLSGEIPGSFENLINLMDLFLNDNQLTGAIPAFLGDLANLEKLNLQNNQFSGPVPGSLEALERLTFLALDFNRLKVPAEPETLADFLSTLNPGWEDTQAIDETIDEDGGTITSRDGDIEVTIDEGTFEDEVMFNLVPQPEPTQDIGNFGFAGNSFQLTAKKGEEPIIGQLDTPFTVRINYAEEELGGVPEEEIILYYWNTDDKEWKDVLSACSEGDYQRNLAENWFQVPICHLSEFSTLGPVAPVFTSGSTATFTVGKPGEFIIEAGGKPYPEFSIEGGVFPTGITLQDHGDGTATLAGSPASGSGGIYEVTIKASNDIGDIYQTFTIIVQEKPTITSDNTTTFTEGISGTFTIEINGYPNAQVAFGGKLPEGISLTDHGDGTAILSGTPAKGSAGTYQLAFKANNNAGYSEIQTFLLEIMPSEDTGVKIFLPLIKR